MIRPLVLGVVRRGDELLVLEGHDAARELTFYRPLGGGIEFGELSEQALHREFREELAVELTDVELLGMLENVFEYEGVPGHEIVVVYAATIADPAFYQRADPGPILDEGTPVRWLPLADVVSGRAVLFPDGLLDLVLTPEER
ncbi:NUDIX hydrolase [Actinomycetospora termitidis]|uniref:NUDIX domain-containing protein n=1 Tax=Actinomycetospora termitidis TaxID=3053470 RepID=A0ABT7MAF6_9PSEU|nr:NUDIX domain-containing protein [Actinomycetospora sp. Odt1-22]MDL5156403.1 NUDIX domain-containing protein [Actinomycetospora sp. Odt1-22]